MTTRKSIVRLCACAAVSLSSVANSAVIPYADWAAFEAETSATTITFEGLAPPGGAIFLPSSFNDAATGFFILSPGNKFIQNTNYYGSGAFFTSQGMTPTVVTLYFPTAINAFAFNYLSDSATVTLSSGESTSLAPLVFPNAGFFGFQSDLFFNAMEIRVAGAGLDFDNVSFGTARPKSVPEPDTSILFGIAILAGGFLGKRKRPQRARRSEG
jgi:hypothetical protein